MTMALHEEKMHCALALAREAELNGEVPVGAVIVLDGEIIAEGYNQVISTNDPTAHAEIIALRQAANAIGNYRLVDATLYSTLEPCCMCAGALVHARIKTLYFAACDPKAGACGSQFQLVDNDVLNHKIDWHAKLLQEESSTMLKNFFKQRRLK